MGEENLMKSNVLCLPYNDFLLNLIPGKWTSLPENACEDKLKAI